MSSSHDRHSQFLIRTGLSEYLNLSTTTGFRVGRHSKENSLLTDKHLIEVPINWVPCTSITMEATGHGFSRAQC